MWSAWHGWLTQKQPWHHSIAATTTPFWCHSAVTALSPSCSEWNVPSHSKAQNDSVSVSACCFLVLPLLSAFFRSLPALDPCFTQTRPCRVLRIWIHVLQVWLPVMKTLSFFGLFQRFSLHHCNICDVCHVIKNSCLFFVH